MLHRWLGADADLEGEALTEALHALRRRAPVQLEVPVGDDLSTTLDRFEPVHEDRNEALGEVVFRWYASPDVLVMVDAPPRRMWFIGRERAPVDAAVPTGWSGARTWWSIDGIHEPATDFLVGRRPGSIRAGARRSGEDLRVVLSITDPAVALERFVAAWYGEPRPEARELLGFQDEYDEAGAEQTEDGCTVLWTGDQFVWQIGHRGEGDDPEVVVLSTDSDERWSTGLPLSAFRLRWALRVARDAAPHHLYAHHVAASDLGRALDGFTRVLPPVTLGGSPIGDLAPVFTDGTLLVEVTGEGDDLSMWVGAHDRDDVVRTGLAHVPGWWWFRHTAVPVTRGS